MKLGTISRSAEDASVVEGLNVYHNQCILFMILVSVDGGCFYSVVGCVGRQFILKTLKFAFYN